MRCDLVVYPSACLAIGCPNLYSYDGPAGRRFVGCIERVFRSEIDLGLLEAALETSSGFGALRCVRPPLKQCSTAIDRAYEHRADVLGCLNPEFGEPPVEPFRLFARIDA